MYIQKHEISYIHKLEHTYKSTLETYIQTQKYIRTEITVKIYIFPLNGSVNFFTASYHKLTLYLNLQKYNMSWYYLSLYFKYPSSL